VTQWDIFRNAQRSSCQAPVILVRFWRKFYFLDRFGENPLKFQILWKSVHWELNCLHADGRTDGRTDRKDETNSGFSIFGLRSIHYTSENSWVQRVECGNDKPYFTYSSYWPLWAKSDTQTQMFLLSVKRLDTELQITLRVFHLCGW